MDFGRLGLARALTEQNLGPFLERGIEPGMMPTPDDAAAFTFVRDFYRRHGTTPSPQTVEATFPQYVLGYAPDPTSAYVDLIVKQHVRVQLQEALLDNAKRLVLATDPQTVADELRSYSARLATLGQAAREKQVTENALDRFQRYLVRKNTVGLLGIPTPWASLDKITQGWQPEMYFGLAARPGVGKTFALIRIGLAAWLAGYKVLFVNIELSDEMMERRFDALGAKLPYEKFRDGSLTDGEEARYERWLQTITTNPPGEWVWLHNPGTISALDAKIEEHKPDLVLVDGAYLMDDEERGRTEREQMSNLSKGFKRITQRRKVPLGITIQLNRDGDQKKSKSPLTGSNVYGSDRFLMDVDFLFGLVQTDDQRLNSELSVLGLKTRDAKIQNFNVGWDFETMESEDRGVQNMVLAPDDADDLVYT